VGRLIAIGDIHGCAAALRALLAEIQPTQRDTLVTLGDYVDRGPNSPEVFELLIGLVSSCRFVPLLGNHELMMAQAFNSRSDFNMWLQFGGQSTLNSYGGDIRNVPMHHRTFLNHCQRYHETDSFFFVHASYDPQLELASQPDDVIYWQHIEQDVPAPHVSNKIAIVGHTPQMDGEVRDLGHIKIVDTFCYGEGFLTAVDLTTGETWQARADGTLRNESRLTNISMAPTGTSYGPATDPSLDADNSLPPLEYDGDRFKNLLDRVGDYLADFLDELPDAPVWPGPSEARALTRTRDPIPREPTDLDTLLREILWDAVADSFNTTSPGYFAYVPGGGLPESAVADLIAQITNRFVTVWAAAPKFAQLEATVVRWFCEFVGYDERAGGYLASGGSAANQTAIATARTQLLPDHDFTRATIYASRQTHHCLFKSAFLAGIPRDNFRLIDVDSDFRLKPSKLVNTIDADLQRGMQPFVLIGNAGTTNTGAVDDLLALREVARRFGLWFHVDAAYGGFFCLTESGNDQLQGLAEADSIVLDPHKGLFLPFGTGCLLVKDRQLLQQTHSFTSEYMPDMTRDSDRVDFCELSPELSRLNRSLRIWLPFKLHGIEVFKEQLTEKLELAQWASQQLEEMASQFHGRLEVMAKPQLSIVAFRVVNPKLPVESINRMNRRLMEEINGSGRVMLSGTFLDGQFVLRLCILSFRSHQDRVAECLDIIRDRAKYIIDSTVS